MSEGNEELLLTKTPEIQMPVTKGRRAKGEQTRHQILEATLRVIADQGYRAATHRAIAKEANVNLSLTTYYFKDLQELTVEAFRLYKQRTLDQETQFWQNMFTYLDQYSEEDIKQPFVCEEVCEHISLQLADKIVRQINEQPCYRSIENSFSYDLHLEKSLLDEAQELYRKRLSAFLELCKRLDSPEPPADADILMGSLQRLEHRALISPEEGDKDTVYSLCHRLLSWMTTAKKAPSY